MNPPRNRKGGAGNPPPKGARASALPDKDSHWISLAMHHVICYEEN